MRRRITRSMPKSDRPSSQIGIKRNGKTSTFLKCQLQRDWRKLLIGRKIELNVLTLPMRHGQHHR